MFGKKVEKAKSDWPVDRVNLKKVHVDIMGQYPAPNHENKVWGFTMLIILPGMIVAWPVALGMAIPVFMLFWMTFKRRLNIRIRPDIIMVNGRRYAREELTEFRVEPHQRAFKPNPGVYERALEVVMQYGEKRITIAEMRQKEEEKALALALRLQSWCERFDEAMALKIQSEKQDAEPASGDFGPAPDIR